MNIGVIGGSGFIGSHLVDKLLAHGHEVTVFDIKKPHQDDVTHIHIDITNLSKTTVALAGNYNVVYLLAAMADVNDVHKNPIEAGRINIMAVGNVLEAAKRNEIQRVILASTVWVYEMAPEKEVSEKTPLSPERANHVYTASKLGAELYCHAYQKLYAQDFTVLRYGIPYGPRARASTVIATFIRKALNHEPLIILGDGSQYRNFVYVEDLALGNVAALETVASNQTYNLDGNRPVTIKEVAETVKRLVGNVKIEYRNARVGDYQGKFVSAEKARRELNWEPKVNLEEGIARYIEWYKENETRPQSADSCTSQG